MSIRLYKMELHERLQFDDGGLFTCILRVPGGWIYRSYDKSHEILSSVFVPFNNEFMADK